MPGWLGTIRGGRHWVLRMTTRSLIGLVCAVTGILADDVPGGGGELVTELPGGAQMEFVWIQPGTFAPGSAGQAPDPDRYEATVNEGFYLARYELTQGQWQSVMGSRPWLAKAHVVEDPQYPAVYISRGDVQDLVQRLNEAAGDSLYRVPTELEWEYASRAGTATRWSFGDDEGQLGAHEWSWEDARARGEDHGHAVGVKLPNPWGLHDMHGNVYEWCRDSYAFYPSPGQSDPTGPAPGSELMFRGGGSTLVHARFYYVGARLVWMGPGPGK